MASWVCQQNRRFAPGGPEPRLYCATTPRRTSGRVTFWRASLAEQTCVRIDRMQCSDQRRLAGSVSVTPVAV